MNPLLKWLPLGAAIVAGSVAWGTQQAEIAKLKEESKQYQAVMVKQSAIDERTKTIQDDMKEQRELLMQILQKVGQ